MLEILTKAIEQLNSSVFILVVMLCVCFWTVYHVGKWTETFLSHSKKIDASEEKHHALFQSLAHIITKVDLIYNNTHKKYAPRNAYDIQIRSMQIANEQFLLLLNESESAVDEHKPSKLPTRA